MTNMTNQTETTIKILLTGRIPCQELLVEEKQKYGEEKLSYYDCFNLMKPVIDEADVTIGALSTASAYPEDFVEALKQVGFDAFTLGTGRDDRKRAKAICKSLDKHGIRHSEGRTVRVATIEKKGIKIGILDCTFNDAYEDLGIMSEVFGEVKKMERDHVDLKLCYIHWQFAIERQVTIDERQRAIAKALTTMGVDYIIGTGTSYLMKYETVKGNWNHKASVAYSLGNFHYCSTQLNQATSAVICLKIEKDPWGNITVSDSYLPCLTWTMYAGKRRRVQFLNNKPIKNEKLRYTLEWRKLFVSGRIGDGIPLCRDFDVDEPVDGGKPEPLVEMPDAFARAKLGEVSVLQKTALDAYRLTEGFRDQYSRLLYSDDRFHQVIKGAEFIARSTSPEIFEEEDAKQIIADMVYSRDVLGFSYGEYFGFHFRDKTIAERLEYVSNQHRLNYYRRFNTDKEENARLDNKWTCYERLKNLYGREIISIEDRSQRDQFSRFAEKYDRFIMKPVNGSLGMGIRVISRSDYDDAKALFDEIFAKAGSFVCEELIIQKDYLSRVHPQSLNTIRIYTFNDDGDIKYLCAILKAGIGDNIVDNATFGGVVAAINMETGMVECDAADESGKTYETHPDTGVSFKGIQIEEWDSLKEMAKEAARHFPTIKIIAWDIGHGENGWQIIEGNSEGMMWVYQLTSGKGMRRELESQLRWTNQG